MAGPVWQADDALRRQLKECPQKLDFFALVRRIEAAHAHLPRIGRAARPADEPLRFGQEPTLAFAPSAIADFAHSDLSRPPRLWVHFFGLYGPNGPLPMAMTQYARARSRQHGDAALSRFCDIFHHRLISLFYRAWALAQPTVSRDRPGEDRFGVFVGSLFGIGMEGLQKRDAVPDAAKCHFAGRLAGATRCSEGLEAVIRQDLGVESRVLPFIGQWLNLPEADRLRLGESPATGSLGRTAIVGGSLWDVAQKFRLRLGPMPLKDYTRLLPTGSSFQRLLAWVRQYAGLELAWDVQMVLQQQEIPPTLLGRGGSLGWTTWLLGRAPVKDADDLNLQPNVVDSE